MKFELYSIKQIRTERYKTNKNQLRNNRPTKLSQKVKIIITWKRKWNVGLNGIFENVSRCKI